MKKFLLPIINIVNIVLVSITFGLGNNCALVVKEASSKRNVMNWYGLVWNPVVEKGHDVYNVIGIVGFFLFVAAVAAVLFTLIPTKVRKWVNALSGAAFIASGVLFLLTPKASKMAGVLPFETTNSLIAMAVLVFVAGALALTAALIEIIPLFTKKEAK